MLKTTDFPLLLPMLYTTVVLIKKNLCKVPFFIPVWCSNMTQKLQLPCVRERLLQGRGGIGINGWAMEAVK